MEPSTTNNYWSLVDVDASTLPDFSMTLFDNSPGSKAAYKYYTDSQNRLKSVGNIQTMLELHSLMYRSLRIISPDLSFSPDFPDYLLPEDHPNYNEEDITFVSGKMPHHRNDLPGWHHNYEPYPSLENVPAPAITWGVVRSEPGTVGGGTPFRGTQERKPRHREFIAMFDADVKKYVGDTDQDFIQQYGGLSKYVKINGQVFDNLVQYNIWARSSWEVEELTEWFKAYMTQYTGMFREAGIVEMWFDRRVRDDTLHQIKNKYHVRSFLYYIRTESLDITSIKPISRIEANIRVDATPSDASINPDAYVVENFHDKLLDKYHQLDT